MATILVIDDVAANREFLVTLLRYRGHRLCEAVDGQQGLASVKDERPDLVITDVLMPVMDGYEFVRQLRLALETRDIPVVFYTAHYGEREARELALSSGVWSVLTKPAEPEEVLRVVDSALSGTSAPLLSFVSPDFDREHLRLVTDKLSERNEDLRAANARLRALINIGLELASERDAGRLLQSVCAAARDLFGATYVTLGTVERNSQIVERLVTSGVDPAGWSWLGGNVPDLMSPVIADRVTIRGNNSRGDPADLRLPAQHPVIRAYLAAPVASPAHVYGWILLVGNEGRPFGDDDEQLLLALAGQVGRIYENGYFYSIARAERDRAQQYLDMAEVILLVLDLSGRIALINRYACALLGWTAQELIGRDFINTCVPARTRTETRRKLSVVHAGDDAVIENAVVTRHGEERLIEWRTAYVRDDQGRIVSTLSSGTDITDRRRVETEADLRAQLSALRASVGLALGSTDTLRIALQGCAEALVVHLNAALARIWTVDEGGNLLEPQARAGLDADLSDDDAKMPIGELGVGRILRDRTPYLDNDLSADPDVGGGDWARAEQVVAVAGYPLVAGGRTVGVMTVAARRPFAEMTISALASIADLVGIGIDRHMSARARRAAEERVTYALESTSIGIWDLDYRTGRLQGSRIFEAHLGLQPGTFGQTIEALVSRIHPLDQDDIRETIARVSRSGGDFSVRYRVLWPDGSVRWLSGSGRIALDDDGAPVRGIGILQDITQQRTLEEQFQQAQKMEAVGRLAGGVAHDFNNLLTAILGYCHLLLSDIDPADPRRADVAEIEKAGVSAASLTGQLLAFSRKQIIEPTLLNLNAIVVGLQSLLGRLIGEDVKIVLGLDAALASVKADRGQVEQVVVNLAVNARDAMPHGGLLSIETANVELDEHYAAMHLGAAPGLYAMLTVTDNGTGMTPEVQRRLFEPFFTTKEPGKGTGLGLATIYGIVARSGGTVGVYSELGRGTSFKVYFPRADTTDVPVEAPALPQPRLGTQIVLLVEDAAGLRELTKRLLERLGYTVIVAGEAEAALTLFEANPSIDVLLTDVVMPGLSGPELARQLLVRRPDLKVIYMSGYTEDGIVHHGILQPGIAFLHKPFTSDALGHKMHEVLDQ